jgi:hypothetical protein
MSETAMKVEAQCVSSLMEGFHHFVSVHKNENALPHLQMI